MALKPPTKFSPAVRRTLHWLVADEWARRPLEASGEAQYLLCHARRLHESFQRLPKPGANQNCLVVGSWGVEVPYLNDCLGWRQVTCVSAPSCRPGRIPTNSRRHPNRDRCFDFKLLEHDIERAPLPFPPESFGLVIFWCGLEHLRFDPEFALYEINRVAEPGATISLVTDNAISFQATHSTLRGHPMPMRLHHPAPEGHSRRYTPLEVSELLHGTGWKVDLLTSIVPDPAVYWKWWKRWLFKKLVADYRHGFGLSEPFWNALILARAEKVAAPTRTYPSWLFKDEKIRQLKTRMLELVSSQTPSTKSA